MPALPHEPQNQRDQRQADQGREQGGLEQISQPQARRGLVEPKALLQHKGLVQRAGQVNQAADQRKAGQQRHLLGHAGADGLQQQLVEPVQPAKNRPAQQDGSAQRHLQQAKAVFGDGVVGRFLVCSQCNVGGKAGRHLLAVLRHMPYLARGQPEFEHQTEHQRGDKNKGQEQRGREKIGRRSRHVGRV